MYRDLKRRIDQLQLHTATEYAEILELIRQGAYYDDITEEQRDLYCAYHGYSREAVETLKDMLCEHKGTEDNWRHSKLTYKKPPVPKDREADFIKMRAAEVRAYMQDLRDDLDAEELEKRQSEWDKWSTQREAAFRKGLNWKRIPAPEWVRSASN